MIASPAKPVATAANAARQRTLARSATITGVGFFSARDVSIRLVPAEPGHGLVFVRTDLPGRPSVPALIEHRTPEPRRTVLQHGTARVEMTEHVLAALVGMGVDNCRIELDGPEPPGLDGSALQYVEAIRDCGMEPQRPSRSPLVIRERRLVQEGDASVEASPTTSGRFDIDYQLDYSDNPGIGRQRLEYSLTPETFAGEIAPARTFIRETEIEWLQSQGIGRRTGPRDLLVFRRDGTILDNELRFPDECVRHKILDAIGDLALVGRPIVGRIDAVKSGHGANAALAAALAAADAKQSQEQPARMAG